MMSILGGAGWLGKQIFSSGGWSIPSKSEMAEILIISGAVVVTVAGGIRLTQQIADQWAPYVAKELIQQIVDTLALEEEING